MTAALSRRCRTKSRRCYWSRDRLTTQQSFPTPFADALLNLIEPFRSNRDVFKGKQDTREIQIHPNLLAYLEAYDPNLRKEFLFPGRHGLGHIHKASADKIRREACFKIGLEGVSTHSFRRTALTRMSDAGVPLRHIQEISGHRTLAALERYLGVTDEQKQNAMVAKRTAEGIATLDF